MTNELRKNLEVESSEKLFYYFKHDGAIDFERKLISGKILHERDFDKTKLLNEKEIIIDSIKNELEVNETKGYIEKKSKKEIYRNIYFWLAYLIIFLGLEVKDYWLDNEDFDLLSVAIILSSGLIFFAYIILTYKKRFIRLIESEVRNNELLRLRLNLIRREWDF